MTYVKVNYAGMQAAHDALVSTWGRIEGHLAELDTAVAATGSMKAETLQAYYLLKSKWDLSAADRQIALQALAAAVADAGLRYQETDRQAALMFSL
ncbi:hypothetical protein EH165_13995 [Nakamurella antarctica]|uniref:WXG100 family type VII secretion target n=1 Tax=Nakamurella antarctica TaxID=1902245 RepID=A0A3G8ZQK2_9ACTN|nr:hypothetical protein [Nakamurella antarctica]AZI59085.1 hypothetical protein EH165_13995 [Nakamurella antarctica]